MSESIDVVYPLGNGSSWMNNELRFSLRSIEKYGLGVRNVYIIGTCPSWIRNIFHVEAIDPYGVENADGNIISKVLAACSISELSDDFLFINDDHILLQQVNIRDIPPYNKGLLEEFVRGKNTQGIYIRRLSETLRVLRERKLPTLHFDCHTPIVINKHKFPNVVSKFDYDTGVGYGMKSLYGNSLRLESPFLPDLNIKTIMTETMIMNATRDKTHMAFNDRGLNHDLMLFLEKRFYKPSKYEKMDKTISLLEQAEQWLENPSSQSEGVQLYIALGKNKHLMSLARADKVGRTQEAIKKHLRAIIDKAKADGTMRPVGGTVKAAAKKVDFSSSPAKGSTVRIDDNPMVRVEELPEDMKALYFRNKEITREMTPLHEKLKNLGEERQNDPQRKEIAEQIVALEVERKNNWEQIDAWWNGNKDELNPDTDVAPIKASGSLTKEQIDEIQDPSIKKESELLRIKANQNYIKRFRESTKKKQIENVKIRKAELDAWGVKY